MIRKFYWRFLFALMLVPSAPLAYAATDDSGSKITWGYKGNIGPERWGELSPNFARCATGKLQSPINITRKIIKTPKALQINYQSAPMIIMDDGVTELMIGDTQTIINDGHGVQLNFPAGQIKENITWNGKDYRLVQFHIHSPSENAWHGRQFPLEIHFVHQGDNGQLAVIGVFVQGGKGNAVLQKIIANLPKESGKEVVVQGQYINPAFLLPTKQTYFSFAGSLTTPPCSEGVQWLVMSDPITAAPAQILALRNASNGSNARPLQPLNKRNIYYSLPKGA